MSQVTKDQLNVGFIGCGDISLLHALGYQDNPAARIYAVCDTREHIARQRAELWKAEHCFTDYRELLALPELDAVEVLLPPFLHKPVVLDACRAGKHVSTQKPMGLNVGECDEMIDAADKAGVKLKVYENFIFYPPFIKARQLVADGIIGEPLSMRVNINAGMYDSCVAEFAPGGFITLDALSWRSDQGLSGGGTWAYDIGFHAYSMIYDIMGGVEKAFAWIDTTQLMEGVVFDSPLMAVFKHTAERRYSSWNANDCPGMKVRTNYYPYDDNFQIIGSEGILWMNRCTSRLREEPALVVYHGEQTESFDGLEDEWGLSFKGASNDFIESIIEDREPRWNGVDGREVLKIAKAVGIAAREHREVDVAAVNE